MGEIQPILRLMWLCKTKWIPKQTNIYLEYVRWDVCKHHLRSQQVHSCSRQHFWHQLPPLWRLSLSCSVESQSWGFSWFDLSQIISVLGGGATHIYTRSSVLSLWGHVFCRNLKLGNNNIEKQQSLCPCLNISRNRHPVCGFGGSVGLFLTPCGLD